MNVTWAGIAAIGVLLFTGYTGYRRGFIKEIVSIFFVFLALALAWTINPYVNTFLMEKTSLYDKIQESCREFSDSQDATEGNGEDEETEDGLISQLPLPEILQKIWRLTLQRKPINILRSIHLETMSRSIWRGQL